MDLAARRRANLGYLNEDAARTYAHRVALIDLSSDPPREVTHGALDRRMEHVAAALQGLGLAAGDRLLLAAGNRSEFIEAFFGAMRAGVVPLPLNIRFGRDTIAYILGDSGCRAAIVEPDANPAVVDIVEAAGLPLRIAIGSAPPGWSRYEDVVAGAATAPLTPPEIVPRQPAFLPYTSGSTGRPKGVLLSHEGMLWAIHMTQRHRPIVAEDRALVPGPLYHKNAMRVGIKPRLHGGGSAVILPHFEPRLFLRALAEYGCTHCGGVPAMYKMALQQKDLLAALRFPRLKMLTMGSEVAGAALVEAVSHAFGVPVHESYGLTEGGGPMSPPLDGRPQPAGSCGVCAPGVELKLTAPDGSERTAEGELWVNSPCVPVGYVNLPELSRQRIVDGFVRTGDICRRDDDGFYYFVGRTDDRFVCGGENIYPKEVEDLLLGHPDVADAAVVAVAHEVKGQVPVALVVRHGDGAADEAALKRHCLAHGPVYAHPRRVFFVDEIPLGGSGKVDAAALRALVAEFLATTGALAADEAGG